MEKLSKLKIEGHESSKLGQRLVGLSERSKPKRKNALKFIGRAFQITDDYDDDCSSTGDSTVLSDDWKLEIPQHQSVQNPPTRQAKRLRFADYVKVLLIPHIDDFVQEDIERLWISREELQESRDECMLLTDRLDAGDEIDFCVRGLDQHTKMHSKRRLALQRIIYAGVFKMYSYRSSVDIDINATISELYHRMSASSVAAAVEIGKADEEEVYGHLI